MSWVTTADSLKKFLSDSGCEVLESELLLREDGKSRGLAFIKVVYFIK